jgi:hypothetical protein
LQTFLKGKGVIASVKRRTEKQPAGLSESIGVGMPIKRENNEAPSQSESIGGDTMGLLGVFDVAIPFAPPAVTPRHRKKKKKKEDEKRKRGGWDCEQENKNMLSL